MKRIEEKQRKLKNLSLIASSGPYRRWDFQFVIRSCLSHRDNGWCRSSARDLFFGSVWRVWSRGWVTLRRGELDVATRERMFALHFSLYGLKKRLHGRPEFGSTQEDVSFLIDDSRINGFLRNNENFILQKGYPIMVFQKYIFSTT